MTANHLEQLEYTKSFVELILGDLKGFSSLHDQKLLISACIRICRLSIPSECQWSHYNLILVQISLSMLEKIMHFSERQKSIYSSTSISIDKDSELPSDSNWNEDNLDDIPKFPMPTDDENVFQLFTTVLNQLSESNKIDLTSLSPQQIMVFKLVMSNQ